VLAVGGTNLMLSPSNTIAASGVWNDADYAAPHSQTAVGGTSAAAPLAAGMIALWTQKAQQAGASRAGFVPPLLYALKGVYLDITAGNNEVFGGVDCCTAGPGFDLASGLGSPMADLVAAQLLP
jgi:subtilase family serine protease